MKEMILPSIHQHAMPLVDKLIANSESLRLKITSLENNTQIIDAGINATGGLEAGRLIAEICMGGLGVVSLRASSRLKKWPWNLDVYSANPVLACLASQYAGWALSSKDKEESFNALGSGPARALGSSEPLYEELNYRDASSRTCMVIESDSVPPLSIVEDISKKCGVDSKNLTIILTPTSSLSGTIQVVARVLETGLHKAHALGFPLDKIIDGAGLAPICPPSKDFITAMSRTNDSILFAGQIHLFVDANDDDAAQLTKQLPSNTSPDYGRPFGEIFKGVNFDFYQIDPMLFSPAYVTISSLQTGHSFHEGEINQQLLESSFN